MGVKIPSGSKTCKLTGPWWQEQKGRIFRVGHRGGSWKKYISVVRSLLQDIYVPKHEVLESYFFPAGSTALGPQEVGHG
jgi:hypothetical protein